MSQPLFAIPPAHHATYQQDFKLPKWSRRVSVASCSCPSTAGRLLRRQLPDWSKEQHLQAARYHWAREQRLSRIWSDTWKRAFCQVFGRVPVVPDYRIAAIGREELPESKKRVLRHCAYVSTLHADLARAHEKAAGLRTQTLRVSS